MQLWEYIPVALSTGGFIAVLDDLSDGYVYSNKPVRLFLTALTALMFTVICWFIRVFVPVLTVCGVIYGAEILYNIRTYFIYNRDGRKAKTHSLRAANEKSIRIAPVERISELPSPLPFYSYTYSRGTFVPDNVKEERGGGFKQRKSV